MKKRLVILLVLAMVLSSFAGYVFAADAGQSGGADVGITPFGLVNWENTNEEFSNISGMPQFWANMEGIDVGDDLRISWGGYDKQGIAERLKTKFGALPEGLRYFTYMAPQSVYRRFNEAVIYLDEGIDMIRDWLDEFLEIYKGMGGQLDGIALDLEYVETGAYYLYTNQYQKGNTDVYNEIVEHPQYQKLRPMLEERGFVFYENPTKQTPEIYGICPTVTDEKYADCQNIWNAVMHDWKAMYLNESVYEPLKKHFPDAKLDDYDTYNSYAWLRTPAANGQGTNTGGNTHMAGNGSNIYTYAHRPSPSFYRDGVFPVGYNKATLEDTSFNAFLWDMIYTKNMYEALEGGEFSAWVTYYDYRIGNENHAKNTVSGTPYHTETIYHIAMLNPRAFYGYVVPKEVAKETETEYQSAEGRAEYDKRMQNLSEIMSELTRVVGASDRKAIFVPSSWNSSFVLSGMYAGGRNVWRISPDTTQGMTLEAFKVSDSDPTFYINGQTVTFPQGKILEEGKINPTGSCGYWVETPTDVVPVITNDEDRYSNYPAYKEDFEGYKDGTQYAVENIKPANVWEVWMSPNASATVQADKDNSGNQVLALKGTGSLRSVKIPERITAGDSYAKQQAWEITVTLPESLKGSAILKFLNASSGAGLSKDGGFKVEGGKLWYGDGEEYKEFKDVDISGGGKFTLRREVDFRNEEAYTSSYYVYDAAGKLIAKAENAAMLKMELPVEGISISSADFTGDPILLDDFKVNPIGVTTDFSLYDADLGIQVDTPDQARAKSTAYRLSWMNATEDNQAYAVVAAHYDSNNKLVSEQVIKDVQMAPNSDGIDTGIVELAEGASSVLVYLKGSAVQKAAATGGIPTAVLIAVPVVLVLAAAACWFYLFNMLKRKTSK